MPFGFMNDSPGTIINFLITGIAAVGLSVGAYAFAVAASCAVAVLRWGAVGQTLAGMFIFGWIQMFFSIGLLIFAQGLSSISQRGDLITAPVMLVAFGVGMAGSVYAGLTILFRRGFEHDFSYTLRNPDRMTLAQGA
jgi:hypothetical protein